jgi:hypothetical protein
MKKKIIILLALKAGNALNPWKILKDLFGKEK